MKTSVTIVLLVFALQAPCPAQDTAVLARKMQEKIGQIQSLRGQVLRARRQQQEQSQALDLKIDELATTRRQLADDLDALQQDRLDLRDQLRQKQDQVRQFTEQLTQAADHALPIARNMQARIRRGIGYHKTKRLDAIAGVDAQLRRPEAGAMAQGLNQLLAFSLEELQRARSIELTSNAATLDDQRQKHAYIIRLGLVQQAFVTEDGQDLAIAAHRQQRDWDFDIESDHAQQIIAALGILQHRQPPRIARFPFTLPTQMPSNPSDTP